MRIDRRLAENVLLPLPSAFRTVSNLVPWKNPEVWLTLKPPLQKKLCENDTKSFRAIFSKWPPSHLAATDSHNFSKYFTTVFIKYQNNQQKLQLLKDIIIYIKKYPKCDLRLVLLERVTFICYKRVFLIIHWLPVRLPVFQNLDGMCSVELCRSLTCVFLCATNHDFDDLCTSHLHECYMYTDRDVELLPVFTLSLTRVCFSLCFKIVLYCWFTCVFQG